MIVVSGTLGSVFYLRVMPFHTLVLTLGVARPVNFLPRDARVVFERAGVSVGLGSSFGA